LAALLNWRGLTLLLLYRRGLALLLYRRRLALLLYWRGLTLLLLYWRRLALLLYRRRLALLNWRLLALLYWRRLALLRCGAFRRHDSFGRPIRRDFPIRGNLSIRRRFLPLSRRAQPRLRITALRADGVGVFRRYWVGEISRPRRRGNRRVAVVGGRAQLRIGARDLFMLPLRRCDLNVPIARRG
jgi:hypothetical protein